MSVLAEFDAIRAALSAPGQPFEMIERPIRGVPMQVYKHLHPNLSHMIVNSLSFGERIGGMAGSALPSPPSACGFCGFWP